MSSKVSVLDIPFDQLTPGMTQYQDVKKAHPDCLVMLRMGDFYEMFYEDAITASKELEITLTARGKGDKRAPLAGVPFHALDHYLSKLVKKGYKVAIVEQLEDPKQAKGLVKRGLVRIVTAGTLIESTMLNEKENNYLTAITVSQDHFAAAFCDMSTGEFYTSAFPSFTLLSGELARRRPSECIIPESLAVNKEICTSIATFGSLVHYLPDFFFSLEKARTRLLDHFSINSLAGFGLEDYPKQISAAGALLHYLLETQKNSLSHIRTIAMKSNQQYMLLDPSTLRNLELLKNIKDGTTRGSLISIIDKTVTPLGARLLKKWLTEPLFQQELIQQRLDAVEELHSKIILREEVTSILQDINDLERLISRVNYGNASPRDLLALRNSLHQLPALKQKIQPLTSALLQTISQLHHLPELASILNCAVHEDPPITTREGGIIKNWFHQQLDELRNIAQNSKQYLQKLEQQEQQRTGISTLKLGYTKVFGYFIEVTRKNVALVPQHYVRKQTTVNSERYITEELKIEEEKILNAEEKIQELEYNLFQDLLKTISKETATIQSTAASIAILDVLCSLAKTAAEQQYTKPMIVKEPILQIRKGRHPVVETLEPRFISNDLLLQTGEMMIITGPNMAGKSTIMRQAALIVLLAQMGSFVPAEEAVVGLTDRIFTRVGAYDDLSSGQSTFMVEMSETAAIMNNATSQSLIVLDEIGRGTSTFDGVAIAWSVAEHILNTINARTLFATHYHVLNKLAETFPKVKNYNVLVKEVGDEIILLHKLAEGGTDHSYGIHVAKIAGLPSTVITRAKEVQQILEKDDEMMRKMKARKVEEQMDLGRF